jgi:hypothetical protein
MLHRYNQRIKQFNKIHFFNFKFINFFILKKKYIKQNIQKEFEYYCKKQNFFFLKTQQRQFLNILKTTPLKNSLLTLKGNLIYLYLNKKNITLSEQILYFINVIQQFKNFKQYFQFSLLLDFQQNLIITPSLLKYYSFNFTNIFSVYLGIHKTNVKI